MRKSIWTLVLALALSFTSSLVYAADYSVDPDHTTVGFKVRHLGISSVVGKFANLEGSFSFDPANPGSAKAEAKINAKSINTEQAKRDTHLRSPDFFDVEKFPEIVFVSREIKDVQGNKFKVVGDLTIRGVTKSVALDAEFGGATKDPWGNERAAFEASGTINRKEFGLSWNKILETGGLVVGDDVKIMLEVEGVKKKA